MIIRNNYNRDALPLYEVKELSLEEALLVIAAEKELAGVPTPAGCAVEAALKATRQASNVFSA